MHSQHESWKWTPRRFWKSLSSAYLQLRYFHIFGFQPLNFGRCVIHWMLPKCGILQIPELNIGLRSSWQRKREGRGFWSTILVAAFVSFGSPSKIFDSIDWWGLMIKCFFMCCFSLCQHDSSHPCMCLYITCCQVFPALPAPTPAPAPGAFTGVSTAGCWMTCHDLLRNGQPQNWTGRGWHSAAGCDACFGAGFIRWGFQWLEWTLQKIKVDSTFSRLYVWTIATYIQLDSHW